MKNSHSIMLNFAKAKPNFFGDQSCNKKNLKTSFSSLELLHDFVQKVKQVSTAAPKVVG